MPHLRGFRKPGHDVYVSTQSTRKGNAKHTGLLRSAGVCGLGGKRIVVLVEPGRHKLHLSIEGPESEAVRFENSSGEGDDALELCSQWLDGYLPALDGISLSVRLRRLDEQTEVSAGSSRLVLQALTTV